MILPVLLALLSSLPSGPVPAMAACPRPWLFFDLGLTLVDTRNDTMRDMTYMPEARDYLHQLREDGFPLGLIVNWPADDGATQAEKQARMKSLVDAGWDAAEPAFDWSAFPPAQTLLSNTATERKPAPAMYLAARAQAAAAGCPIVFQGEDAREVEAARQLGIRAWQVGRADEPFYAPESFLLEALGDAAP
jgi:FMN phosphatase YigB (HAD superfamily)